MHEGFTSGDRFSVSDAVASTSLPDETVVLDPRSSEYYSLAGVASRVWAMIEEGTRFDALVQAIVEEFEVDEQTCAGDLTVLLRDLEHRGLIVVDERQA